MSRRQNRRYFGDLEKEELLKALGECRKACIQAEMKAPINGPIYKVCSAVMDAIDELAGVLTGDRTHFHSKGGSVSSSQSMREWEKQKG